VPTTLILPHISIKIGFTELEATDTRIALINTSFTPANITAQLFGTDGILRGSVPDTLAVALSERSLSDNSRCCGSSLVSQLEK